MIKKEEYLESIIAEITIIRHLASKITPEMLEYRPHEKQRDLLELMGYLAHAFSTGFAVIKAGDSSIFRERALHAPKVTIENFDSLMESQAQFIRDTFSELTDEELQAEVSVFNRTATRAIHLLGIMKWAAAYKMQLFLYIKATGNHSIGTSNLWGGVDMPPKA